MFDASIATPSSASDQPVLRCEALEKIYKMGEVDVRALDGIDFSRYGGELLVLLGVQAGTPLLEIGGPAGIEVVVDLLTTDAVHVKPGTPAVIQGWGGDATLAGKVRVVEPSAFTRLSALGVDEQRVNVVIAQSGPREMWALLGEGFGVEARFVLWEAPDVLKVPLGAVFRHGDDWAAYVVDDGKSKLVSIELGHRGETEVEVLSGLPEGATVAVHPGDRVKDGAHVEAR
jgi:HlyD family secretion protein